MNRPKTPQYEGFDRKGRRGTAPVLAALGFLGIIGAAVFLRKMPAWALLYYLCMSAIAFAAYAGDKAAARASRRRIPEIRLHMLGLAGGWPGALIAQQTLRHKSSKQRFQAVFWLTVIVHCAVFGWLTLWPYAQSIA